MSNVTFNILAVRNDRFGEFLLNIPAFRALRQSYKDCRLTLVVDPYVVDLSRCIDFVDEVLTWENRRHNFSEIIRFSRHLKEKRFSLSVVFNPNKEFNLINFFAGIPRRVGYNRKWGFLLTQKMPDAKHLGLKHEVEYNLELAALCGANTEDKTLSLKIPSGIINTLLDELTLNGKEESIAIHPWTSDPLKQWPVENFQALARGLAIAYPEKKIMVVGGTQENPESLKYFRNLKNNIINATGMTSLLELAVLLKRCRLLISGDSGPVHLASAVGTQVLALFRNDLEGKTAIRWGPWGKNHLVIEKPSLLQIGIPEVLEKVKEALR
jgi:ADP-heptose:LPS heptosyltransferase